MAFGKFNLDFAGLYLYVQIPGAKRIEIVVPVFVVIRVDNFLRRLMTLDSKLQL